MTEITKTPVPQIPVAIRWLDETAFDVSIEVRLGVDSSMALSPALTPNDTGFLAAPPSLF